MEMIIGCIFLGIILVILLIFCKNVTLNVNITYSQPQYMELSDQFDEEGNPKIDANKVTIDDVLKEVNSIMLGREDELNE